MRSRPLVSVCIPTRDRAEWLAVALRSVFAQTLEDFEVIVFDDASTDGTRELVRHHAEPRLVYRCHQSPVGVAVNRNACLSLARGKYVAWLDSDDCYLPHMLETQSDRLERQPASVLAHGAVKIMDGDGEPLPDWRPLFAEDTVELRASAFRELVLQNYIAAPSVMVRRAAYDVVGPYRNDLVSGEDWEMWLRIALYGDLAYTAQPVARYRWHPRSLTRRVEARGTHLRRDLRIISLLFARHERAIGDPKVVEGRARAAVAVRAIDDATDRLLAGDRRRALRSALMALRARPALSGEPAAWRMLRAATQLREYDWHVESRQLLARLADVLDGSRMGAGVRRRAEPQRKWESTLRRIAGVVRDVVPPHDAIAVVDKWDPTLLHLARRRGWHFPDRRTMPEGYPPDSRAAVRHLEQLRLRGARHLVVPCSAFWWLECYEGLARHLDVIGTCSHRDDRCIIYRLTPRASSCAA